MSYTLVDNIADIDLTRHALIEASAGTGKTYTLESLVVRLLKERPDIAIENILMVTFTEKATSELKTRIQAKLLQELRSGLRGSDDSATARKIRDTLDAFDTASIYTIHGFCNTVLQDFAFENGSLFQNEVVADAPVFDALIKEQMRKGWPEVYGQDLIELLQVSGFSTRKNHFLATVVNLARRVFRPGVGDQIRPDPHGRSIARIRSDVWQEVIALKDLIGVPPSFSDGFNRLNINAGSKKALLTKMVLPLETYLSGVEATRLKLSDLAALMDQVQNVKSAGRKGIACLIPENWTKSGNNLEVCPNLEVIARRLENLAEALLQVTYYLAIDTIKRLQADVARFKRQNGWISYDDMLSRVATALHSERPSGLLQRLRTKYKVAFVDEFQDTDPVQWRIFRRLFLDRESGPLENLLFLIGDPKQAIYSFRGADVYAYMEARSEMERLARGGRAGLYSLATNWRSKAELVTAFNHLFGRAEWFPPHGQAGPFAIGYQRAGSPHPKDMPAVLAADRSRRPALNVVDLCQAASPGQAKPMLARFIAQEVRYLVDSGGIELRAQDGERRPLAFGDIGLLVRGKPDALLLEPELTDLGIPYSFYKKPGLFLSEEALYLSLVCHAVLDPGRIAEVKKALLTPFFDYKPVDLLAYESLAGSHPLKQLLLHWHDLACRRKWGQLFQSLLEDSGLIFREAGLRDWDRKYTNFRQVIEHLEALAYRNNLDFRGLSALLDSYRKQTVGAEEEADIHQIETEAQKVQIMTMHVSKGLQFPVVFIAGGLTQPAVDDYHVYHDYDPARPEAGIRKIIDLAKRDGLERHAHEKAEEDKRLYYVALTRAQFKLYVPFFPATSKAAWMGPVCRFVSRAITAAFPQDDDYPEVGWMRPETHAETEPDPGRQRAGASAADSVVDRDLPCLPSSKDFRSRRITLESFSSLHSRLYHYPGQSLPVTGFQVEGEKDKGGDERFPGIDADRLLSVHPEDELPGGADVGSMFHDILEHIDFEAVTRYPDDLFASPPIRNLIVKAMEAYRVEERWRPHVGRIVANTLTTPISAETEPFVLARLKKEDRVHEVEFYYPFAIPTGQTLQIPSCDMVTGHGCYIRGYVDLVFRHNGKFFIADWKSNRLDNGYGRQELGACMDAAGYHMQYKLYTVAVLRWLQQVFGDRFDAGSQFGGVYYLFLRGMGTGNGNGVYFAAPHELGSLTQLEAEISALTAGPLESLPNPRGLGGIGAA